MTEPVSGGSRPEYGSQWSDSCESNPNTSDCVKNKRESMKHGTYILDILQNTPKDQRTILLIRHSIRESFAGVPDHLYNTVGITPEGSAVAREFGEAIKEIAPDIQLYLSHTVAKRAEMTARSICEGYSSDNQSRILGCEPEIQSPVVNLEKLVEARNRFGWQELLRRWLEQEISEDVLWDHKKYSDEILRKLLSYPAVRPGDMLVVVAHDITLFPLVFSLFGKPVQAIEFLNGVVISADGNVARIQFKNADLVCETERPIFSDE